MALKSSSLVNLRVLQADLHLSSGTISTTYDNRKVGAGAVKIKYLQ